ncbi:MAG: hypothetical protein GX963_03155 [Bacteroidales bacterium]|nr:hypothetical protein [Bacteroidales bacterium]
MNNNRPILHISIYYSGSSQIKAHLRKKLTAYSKRLAEDPCNPIVDIRIDNLDAQEEKRVLLELSYDGVMTNSLSKQLKNAGNFYTVIATLAALTMQRLYEKNTSAGTENWLLISLTPLMISANTYKIKWLSGYNCC